MTRDLCIMACTFCRDPAFHAWLAELSPPYIPFTEEMAKAFICEACGITSRNALDHDAVAAERFHNLVRLPFLAWKAERPRSEGLSVEHAAAPLALGAGAAQTVRGRFVQALVDQPIIQAPPRKSPFAPAVTRAAKIESKATVLGVDLIVDPTMAPGTMRLQSGRNSVTLINLNEEDGNG